MEFLGWMYDVAREQSPGEAFLRGLLLRSAEAGYSAAGLYLEHRFAYPSAPWAAAPGSLEPEAARRLAAEARSNGLRLIPFLNVLGHMEGFIRSEGGQWLAEAPASGALQMCPSRPECAEFAWGLVADAMDAFDDEWVHLGGDETTQLGACSRCAERARAIGEAGLYAEHFGTMCRRVLERGRRPCLWGDMLVRHPEALERIPKETVIFDWNYDRPPVETTRAFRRAGFDVVCCPALRTFDAGWCHLDQTRRLIDGHAEVAGREGALGLLVCAWEFFGFSSLAAALPLVWAAGRRLARGEAWAQATEAAGGAAYARAAEILGNRVPAAAALLAPGRWRALREGLALRGNPFRLWEAWRGEACGPAGDAVLRACEEALALLPAEEPLRFPAGLHGVAVGWVRLAEAAYRKYAEGDPEGSAALLEEGEGLLGELRPGLERIAEGGGSAADLARLEGLIAAVGRARERLLALPRGGWRPAFETLVGDAYLPGDQAAWRA